MLWFRMVTLDTLRDPHERDHSSHKQEARRMAGHFLCCRSSVRSAMLQSDLNVANRLAMNRIARLLASISFKRCQQVSALAWLPRDLAKSNHQHADQHAEDGPRNEPYSKPTHHTASLGLIRARQLAAGQHSAQ